MAGDDQVGGVLVAMMTSTAIRVPRASRPSRSRRAGVAHTYVVLFATADLVVVGHASSSAEMR